MKTAEKKSTPVPFGMLIDLGEGTRGFADGSSTLVGQESQSPQDGEYDLWKDDTHTAANNDNWRCAA
ncbi:MAG: hypothetical protein IPG33_13495 [Betaproteobacteria bacterium]|jgi:hypothetical protein|nr:hypothetical protein [Betaproteobacteria bacterium]